MAPNEEIKTGRHHDPSYPFDMFLGSWCMCENATQFLFLLPPPDVVFSWSGPVPWGRAAAYRSIDHQCIVIVALRPPLFRPAPRCFSDLLAGPCYQCAG